MSCSYTRNYSTLSSTHTELYKITPMSFSITSMVLRLRPPSCSTTGTLLPTRPIPGSYGLPLLGPLKDRLDYFWFQGQDTFFRSRMETHKSTVFRTNMPPTFPFFGSIDPRVVAVLDCSSFSSLFDLSVVDKRDVLIGSYTPSLSFTGGTRVVVYLDPSEPKHKVLKTFCFDLLKRSSRVWVSEFMSSLDAMFATLEQDVASKGSVNLFLPLQKCMFSFLTKALVGADPNPSLGELGFAMLDKWLALQILPTQKVGVILQPLEELLLHSSPFPFALVRGDYQKLYDFVKKQGQEVVQLAITDYGLSEHEAINNILFVLGFNAFGGFSVFLPGLISRVGSNKTGLQTRIRAEVKEVMRGKQKLGFEAVGEMELVRSVVYEALRVNPPVPLQYARARTDFVIKSHESSFSVKKGELLCGYQPLVMRDPKVFRDRPEEFLPDRFVGDDGRELLNYLFWSNGPETGAPTVDNKQCAAKDYVVSTACMLVAEIFQRYDSFECDSSLAITKLNRAMAEIPSE